MFALRGIAVSFSVFALVYCVLSSAVCLSWSWLRLRVGRDPARRVADLLFALRILPFATAALVTTLFTVPSFLLLEPRTIDEPVGGVSLVLGLCGVGLGIFGMANALLALHRASTAIRSWTRQAERMPSDAASSVPILRIGQKRPAQNLPAQNLPAMIAAGIAHPIVLVSSLAESQLSDRELRSALHHEIAHVRRRDNLKKLLLRFVAFPGMAALEAAWLEATEMAADDAAVSSTDEALDLAAALIKLSRLGAIESPIALTAALIHNPASAMNARVQRLIAWTAARRTPSPLLHFWYGLGAILLTGAGFVVTYSQLLVHVHMATEWLVR